MTPAAIGQMRADTDAVLERFDAGMCRVLTKYAPRCGVCDDTGDVNGLDGEWRGYCFCAAGIALRVQVETSTLLNAPLPIGEATESDFGALLAAVQADPLRRHFEDHEGEA